jgi:hypothetical protein
MQAPFKPALKADRDRAAVARYLGPDGYLRLISEELEPARGSAPPWDTPGKRSGSKKSEVRFDFGLPTLEGLLRLSMREPERLKAVAKTVAMLEREVEKWSVDRALDEDQRATLEAFRRLWKEVGAPLAARCNATEA